MSRTFNLVAALFLVGCAADARDALRVNVHDTVAQWTVMVFVNGDNNLESAALDDLDEMEQAVAKAYGGAENVQLVVQMDRSPEYVDHGKHDWSGARRYVVGADESDTIDTPHLEDVGPVDSGDWNTVADFVAWSAEHFPSEHSALVIWNHGGGWKSAHSSEEGGEKAISDDESTGNAISVAEGELEELLVATTAILERPLDLLGMDACLMQTFEVAWTAAPYADAFVASQELEGNDGWAYDTAMADLFADPDMSGAELGERIAERYHESGDRTQSVVDLAHLDAIADALDALAATMLDSGDDASTVFLAAKQEAWASNHEAYAHTVDLVGLMQGIAAHSDDAEVIVHAEAVVSAVEAAVVLNRTNGRRNDNAHGMSIYAEHGREHFAYDTSAWSDALLWDDLLDHVYGD